MYKVCTQIIYFGLEQISIKFKNGNSHNLVSCLNGLLMCLTTAGGGELHSDSSSAESTSPSLLFVDATV